MCLRVVAAVCCALVASFFSSTSARADDFDVTGQTNVPLCAQLGDSCANVSYSLNLQTQSAVQGPYGYEQSVTALTGTINGQSITPVYYLDNGTYDGWLLPTAAGSVPYGMIRFILGGQNGDFFTFDDIIAGSVELDLGGGGSAYVTWNAIDASTPEPSSILLLCIGMLAAFGLCWKRLVLAPR
jgi:hypothetical protein